MTNFADGEQQAGILFRKDEKVRIAEALAKMGVHRIEAGTPAVSKEDEEAVREIVRHNFGPKIFALARCVIEDVKKVADCGVHGRWLRSRAVNTCFNTLIAGP